MSDGTLVMNQGTVEAEAATISNAKQCLLASALSSIDGESTIAANKNGQKAFEKAQRGQGLELKIFETAIKGE